MSALILALAISGIHGCSGEVFNDVEDYRSVVTMRIDDAYYQFDNVKTYKLCDTVLNLTEKGESPVAIQHTEALDDAILTTLRNRMTARGFTEVSLMADPETGETPEPDVMLVAQIVAQAEWDYQGVVQLDTSDDSSDSDDSDNQDDLGNLADFANKTIYYPKPSVDMSYDVESIVITMFARNVTVAQHPAQYYALWTAGIHTTYNDLTVETLRQGILKAFAQSPYISAPAGVE